MLVSEVVVLATAVVTFISTIAASSCCAYICKKHENQNTIELLKKIKGTLADLIDSLRQKDKAGAVITPELPKFIIDADGVLLEVGKSIAMFKEDETCLSGLMPNLWAQKKARIQIEKNVSILNSWIRKAEIMDEMPVIGYRHLDEAVIVVGKERRETAEKVLNLITSGYPEPGTICIHGPFGVGKTVIAKYIYNKALTEEDRAFDNFIWVNVKHEASLWKVQEDLAKALEVDLPKRRGGDVVVKTAPNDTADTVERAGILEKALLQKGNFLLVLDSIWQPLSFHDIGIPQLVGGRKLIVTSRKRTVCNDIMRPEMVEIIPLRNAIEARDLFHKEIESLQGLEMESITDINRALLEELCGFPLAINKLAWALRDLRNQEANLNSSWMNELDYLVHKPINQEGRDLELFKLFRNSYNNLNERTRCCFQYCVLFPKDYVIESKELIEYWMWEGLLGDFATLEEGMEKGTQALRELKNAHLLQNGSDHEKVKLLSLVRSITIATMVFLERKPICIRSGSSLASLPPSGTYWNSMVERASFMENKIEALDLKEKLDCGQLCTLLLQDNPLVSDSNQAFFSSMVKLKVLDLSRTNISTLPESLSSLIELRALLLCNCPNLSNLPSLSRLSELMVLDLSGTPLKHCPKGIESMKKLRRLNLSHTKLGSFHADVVGKLTELEELLMITDLGCVWGLTEDEEQQGGCIEDLLNLRKVCVLQLHFQSVKAFHKYITKAEMGINVPSKFLLYVGDVEHGGYVQQNSLIISGRSYTGTSGYSISGPELILTSLQKLKNLNVLDVSNFSDLSYLFSIDILKYLTPLRELCVRSCEEMVEVVCQTPAKCEKINLPHLTKIVFFDLPKLKSVCCGAVLDCPALKSVEVWRCENLKLPMLSNVSDREIQIRGERVGLGAWSGTILGIYHTFKVALITSLTLN